MGGEKVAIKVIKVTNDPKRFKRVCVVARPHRDTQIDLFSAIVQGGRYLETLKAQEHPTTYWRFPNQHESW